MSSTYLARQLAKRIEVLDTNPRAVSLKAKLNPTAVRDIIEGKSQNPKHSTVEKIAKVLGCTVADLTGEKSAHVQRSRDDSVSVHELDVQAAAGLGADTQGDVMASDEPSSVVGTFTFPAAGFREAYGAPPDGVRMISVRGDSMIPTLWPGQRCMVDTTDRAPSPPGVFVVWDGMGLVLKRIELVPGSEPPRVRLSSDNSRYQPYERTVEEAYINGRVIGVWARM